MTPIIIGRAKPLTEAMLNTLATTYTVRIAAKVVTEVMMVLLMVLVQLTLNTSSILTFLPMSFLCSRTRS